jgi:hypothetical protein
MYGIDAGMGGKMRSIATMKAKKKKSKTSKIGDMLDKKEMEQAPRRPSVTKAGGPSYGRGKPGKRMEMKDAPTPRPRKIKDLANDMSKPVKPTKMILTKAMRKKSTQRFKPGGDK